MGNELNNSQPRRYLPDLANFTFELDLNKNSLFLKTFRMNSQNYGTIIAKSFPKIQGIEYEKYIQEFKKIKMKFKKIQFPNILSFQLVELTQNNIYIIRPYIDSNLFERIGTHPELTLIEKKWIIFQLLKGLEQTHSQGIIHGDIKMENILLTSSLWVFLVDFEPFKPVSLPENNPTDFISFFNSSAREVCYIAPERFFPNEKEKEKETILKPEMDIFSLGCLIAELISESPLFNLSEILNYKNQKEQFKISLDHIKDQQIQEMISSMISLDPQKRLNATQYLENFKNIIFPEYFYNSFHTFFGSHLIQNPEKRSQSLFLNIPQIFQQLNIDINIDLENEFSQNNQNIQTSDSQELFDKNGNFHLNPNSQQNLFNQKIEEENILKDEELLKKAKDLLEKINDNDNDNYNYNDKQNHKEMLKEKKSSIFDFNENLDENTSLKNSIESIQEPEEKGLTLIANEICSIMRNIPHPNIKLDLLKLLLIVSKYVPDYVKSEKIIPYVISMLEDKNGLVRATSIQITVNILQRITHFYQYDYLLFPQYLLPQFMKIMADQDLFVKITFVKFLPKLTFLGKKFLFESMKVNTEIMNSNQEIAENMDITPNVDSVNQNGNIPMINEEKEMETSFSQNYKIGLEKLHDIINKFITKLFEEKDPRIKIELLSIINEMNPFYESDPENNPTTNFLITLFNDKDWKLKYELLDKFLELKYLFREDDFSESILPCIVGMIDDVEEIVIHKTIELCEKLVEMNEIPRSNMIDIFQKISPLLIHPNIWIRHSSVKFLVAISKKFNIFEFYAEIFPILKPYLRFNLVKICERDILNSLVDFIPRYLYEKVVRETYSTKEKNFSKMEFAEEMSVTIIDKISKDNLNITKKEIKEGNSFGKGFANTQSTFYLKMHKNDSSEVKSENSFGLNMTQKHVSNKYLKNSIDLPENRKKLILLKPFIVKAAYEPRRVEQFLQRKKRIEAQKMKKMKQNQNQNLNLNLNQNLKSDSLYKTININISENIPFQIQKVNLYESKFTIFRSKTSNENQENLPNQVLTTKKAFKPKGINIATNSENKGSIQSLSLSYNDYYISSCSSDGVVKIFTTQSLFQKGFLKSKITLTSHNQKYKCVSFCGDSQVIAIGLDNGEIRFFDTNSIGLSQSYSSKKFGKIGQIETSPSDAIVDIQNRITKKPGNLDVLYATHRGNVYLSDLRQVDLGISFIPEDANTSFHFKIPQKNGLITSMMIEPDGNWVAIGTSNGYIVCYDIRFLVPFQNFQLSKDSMIHDIQYFYESTHSFDVAVSTGVNHVVVCDVSEAKTKYRFDILDIYDIVGQFESGNNYKIKKEEFFHKIICSPDEFMITTGTDRCIRYWDLHNLRNSYVVSGVKGKDNREMVLNFPDRSREPLFANESYNSNQVKNAHKQSVLELRMIQNPFPMLVSGSQDGIIKIWK